MAKAAEKNPSAFGGFPPSRPGPTPTQGVSLRDPGPTAPAGSGLVGRVPPPSQQQQHHPMQQPPPQTSGPFQQRPPPPLGQGGALPPGPVPPHPHLQQGGSGGIPRPYVSNGPQLSTGAPQAFNGHPHQNTNVPTHPINGPPLQHSNPLTPQGFVTQPGQSHSGPPPQGFIGPSRGPPNFNGPIPPNPNLHSLPQFSVPQGRGGPVGNQPGPAPRRF